MDEKSLSGAFSQYLPGQSGPAEQPTQGQDNLLVTSLKAVTAQVSAPLAQAVEGFLSGEGELHETTRATVAKSGTSSVRDLTTLLAKQFNLKGPVAELVSALLVKLLPSIVAKEKETKKKPRKEKPKTSASGKTATSTKKKPKPKTASEAKKPKAKPKPKTSAKKKPAAKK